MIGLVNLLVSLEQGHWSYPGENFVGWFTLAGLFILIITVLSLLEDLRWFYSLSAYSGHE